MSLDDVTRFLDQVVSDPSIESAMDAAVKDKADVAAVAVALGKNHGLRFTEEEFIRTVDAVRRQRDGELNGEVLAGVVGGFNPQPTPPGNQAIGQTPETPTLPGCLQTWRQTTR